jgi:tellurite resistance protein
LVQGARQRDALKEALINDIAVEWQEKVQSSKNGMRMKKNELSTLIEQKKEAHELTHIEVSSALIHQCIRKISQFALIMLVP